MDFDTSLFWPALKDAGMLKCARVALANSPETIDRWVGFVEPDVTKMNGSRSKEYEIEYQFADLPTLREGDEMLIDGGKYRVRSSPYVPEHDALGNDGTWRRVLLTREA